MAKIWNYFFNLGINPTNAWLLAIKSIQSLLICTKIGMQKIREQREKNLTMQVEDLEKRANTGSTSLKEAKASLNWILDRDLEEKALFFREWWVGKVDRPSPEMFAMLKVKYSS